MARVLQWVASRGVVSNVSRMTRSTSPSLMRRGAPGRGSSSSPSKRWRPNRIRHLPIVCLVRRSSRADTVLALPAAPSSTNRARSASARAVVGRRAQRSSVSRSSSVRASGGIGRPVRMGVPPSIGETTNGRNLFNQFTTQDTRERSDAMKDGLRFVDSDMHIMEPPDLFDRYLDPKFKHRISVPVGSDGKPNRGPSGLMSIDGLPSSDMDLQQYRKRVRPSNTQSTQLLSNSRIFDTGRLDFAIERDYDPQAQVMGMAMEGVDIAVLYPTHGLALIARDNMDPLLSLAIRQAYNNWIHEFCRRSPDQLKFVAMLPVHDVHLACRELVRCVRELGAVGSFIRPNLVNDHYWHSNYWDPLYTVH